MELPEVEISVKSEPLDDLKTEIVGAEDEPATSTADVKEIKTEDVEQPSYLGTVVIHPGSMYLRIGLANEPSPITLYNVIARRNKSKTLTSQEEPYLVPAIKKLEKDAIKQFDQSIANVSNMIASHALSLKLERPASKEFTKVQQFNKNSKAVLLPKDSTSVQKWSSAEHKPDIIVGEEVLLLKPAEEYHIRWPIRRGQLNLHSGPGGSLSSVLHDLESIWSKAVADNLGIPIADLNKYRAVLVIPDIYNRVHVRELVSLLLRTLGFGCCFVQHEAICATFGAGLASATVVDVGDQKTSISCVEDGISERCTRITLDYGGSDITQLFHYLLRQRSFPYTDCKSESRIGGMLLQYLKENFCHLDTSISGTREKTFQVSIPDQPVLQYVVMLGDECLYAPLAMFEPQLFTITGNNKRTRTLHEKHPGDSDDPFDENYLLQTKRKYGEANLESETVASAAGEEPDLDNGSTLNSNNGHVNQSSSNGSSSESALANLRALDQAIVQCIDHCPTDDMKRRMYSCILLVGGGLSFTGVDNWLRHRLIALKPNQLSNNSMSEQPIEIITRPKDIDSKIVVWRGAALMSLLDTTNELWFDRSEWDKLGSRVLRQKSAFLY